MTARKRTEDRERKTETVGNVLPDATWPTQKSITQGARDAR